MSEYEALAAVAKRSDAQDERLAALGDCLVVEQTRFEVCTLNTMQFSRFQAARRDMFEWMEGETGLPYDKMRDHPRLDELFDVGLRWARLTAAVGLVERRTVRRMGADSTAGPWEPADFAGLDDIPQFLETVPAALSEALDELAIELNPGLFRKAAEGEDAKKNGGIIAG